MAAFAYKALDDAGKQHKGVMEADTPRQVRQQVRDKGWTPLSVEEVQQREAKRGKSSQLFNRGISPAELSLITRQFATLMRSGTPIDQALHAVSRQTDKARLSNMLLALRAKLNEGHELATAMADFPHIFNELYRATVSAGEQSGHLDTVLERLADYTEARHALQQKLQLALVYPVLIVIVAILVVVGLVGYVVPMVVEVFEGMDQELPTLTTGLIALSDFLQGHWVEIIVVVLGSVFGFSMALKREKFRRKFHWFLLRVPLVSRLVRGTNSGRFTRTFSILAASGVPALDAMQISAEVVTNLPMRAAVEEAALKVREGTAINKALDASGYFPPMTVHLIASGEASGNLDDMLERAASTQEKEVESIMAVF
ncbi:type II secretion system inner membrane protein GspF, partial [Pseudomonadota bacterium]